LTAEAGIYCADLWGVRVEENVAVYPASAASRRQPLCGAGLHTARILRWGKRPAAEIELIELRPVSTDFTVGQRRYVGIVAVPEARGTPG